MARKSSTASMSPYRAASCNVSTSGGGAGAAGNSGGGGNKSGGASGGAAGGAGRAVTFSGVSAYTIIGTNSGTINGAYT